MIVAKNLSKSFGSIKALDNLNFCINKGDIVSLLGPNGAGKTTLLRLITGRLFPDQGSVDVFGRNPASERVEVLQKIGYVPENAPLYPEMTVYEFIRYAAGLHRLPAETFQTNLPFVAAQLRLQPVMNQRIDTLSKGFRHRVAIASALIASPRILILDEPTEGLDPNQKFEIHRFIREYGRRNIIIVSTHILEEVEAVSNRVILLHKGKLVRDTTPQELKSAAPGQELAAAFRLITGEE